jgi:hypothetical protein
VPAKGADRRFEMKSYDSMGIAAEFRMQQLLAEADHRRLVRDIESGHDHRSPSSSIRARVAARFQRVAGTTTGKTAVEGYKGA